MPQKRNPDGAELTRGKAGRVVGHLMAMLTTMKGLPLTYNRDLQEDKEGVFDALDTILVCTEVMADTLAESTFCPDAATRLLTRGHLLATELADFLVGRGLPFRHAHEAVGVVIRWCESQGRDLSECSEDEIAALDARFDGCAVALDVRKAVNRRDHVGGAAAKRVRAAVSAWVRKLERD